MCIRDRNQIEQNIEKIKEAQGLLTNQPIGEELDSDARMKINDDLLYLNEMLKANKEELANLKKKIKNSTFKSEQLERSLTRLTKSLEEQSAKAVSYTHLDVYKRQGITNTKSPVIILPRSRKVQNIDNALFLNFNLY